MSNETQSTRAGDGNPAGWKLVPIEPTPEMLDAPSIYTEGALGINDARELWARMLAAAPAAVPAGFALVPLEPTTGMVTAWLSTPERRTPGEFFGDAYAAMIAAAPYAAAPAAAPAVPTKTDLARLWRDTNGSNRWPADVDAFVNAWLAIQAPATADGSQP